MAVIGLISSGRSQIGFHLNKIQEQIKLLYVDDVDLRAPSGEM